jgi:hypothetical protein
MAGRKKAAEAGGTDTGAAVFVDNPTKDSFEFGAAGEMYSLSPGANKMVPKTLGLTAQRLGEAALEQLGGKGLVLRATGGKRAVKAEPAKKGAKKGATVSVFGRAGATLYPADQAKALEGVQSPPAEERMQPIRQPEATDRGPSSGFKDETKKAKRGKGKKKETGAKRGKATVKKGK